MCELPQGLGPHADFERKNNIYRAAASLPPFSFHQMSVSANMNLEPYGNSGTTWFQLSYVDAVPRHRRHREELKSGLVCLVPKPMEPDFHFVQQEVGG